MAVTIEGVRIKSFEATRQEAGVKVTGSYEVVGTNGAVFAVTNWGSGYGQTPVVFSALTMGLVSKALDAMKQEINTSLGLD